MLPNLRSLLIRHKHYIYFFKKVKNNFDDLGKNGNITIKTDLNYLKDLEKKGIGKMKKEAGKSKSETLLKVSHLEIDTKPIFDDFVNFLGKSNLTMDAEGKIKNIPGKVANIGDDSIKDIQNMTNEMMEVFTRDKIDLGSLDALVDKIQDGINFKSLNRPGALPSKTEKQISGFLGKSLNDRLKQMAGEEFVKHNNNFRKYLKLENKLSKLLGEDGSKGGSLMKAVFSPTDRGVKKLFEDIKGETGVDLIKKAGLAKFAMQAVGDGRQASLLEALDLGPGFTSKLRNKLSNIPIVGNVVDLGEMGAKKVFSPEKVGRKIVGKSKTEAKNYTNVNSNLYKNITEKEAEKIVKKYFGEEVGVEFLEKIKTPEGLEALGRYKNSLIEFAKNPKENVVHHEALHAYFDLAVSKNKQKEILDLIKKEKNFKTDLDAEEFLADSFADFVIGRKTNSISEKLRNFLSDLSFKFKNFFGKENKVEAIFRDLEDIGKGKKDFEKVNFGNKNDEKYFIDENGKNIDISEELGSIFNQTMIERQSLKTSKGIEKFHNKYVRKISKTPAKLDKIEVFTDGKKQKLNSINIYEADGYRDINKFLRNGETNFKVFTKKGDLIRVIENLDNSFIETDEGIRLARGLQLGRTNDEILDNIKKGKIKIGDFIEDKGFISTSVSAGIGSDFSGNILYVIDIKKGSKILPIKGKIFGNEEFEFLLPRNSKMKIKDIKYEEIKGAGNGENIVLHLEI